MRATRRQALPDLDRSDAQWRKCDRQRRSTYGQTFAAGIHTGYNVVVRRTIRQTYVGESRCCRGSYPYATDANVYMDESTATCTAAYAASSSATSRGAVRT